MPCISVSVFQSVGKKYWERRAREKWEEGEDLPGPAWWSCVSAAHAGAAGAAGAPGAAGQ